MYDYRNPAGITRAATVALAIYMLLDLAGAGVRFAERVVGGIGDLIALPTFVVMLVCFVLVGRWIYVANANAHSYGTGEMSITPGWGVGWFFVPFANLVKPYEGVKETWRVSHHAGGLLEEGESPIVGWWWGLWIANGILGWVSMQLGGGLSGEPLEAFFYFDLLASLFNAGLCLVLIRLMNRLARTQRHASEAGVFA